MIPTHRSPSHPGEILRHDYREPLDLSQEDLARALDVSFKTINAIERGRQSITTVMALRLARCLRTTPQLWLTLQQNFDLYDKNRGSLAEEIHQLKPLKMAVHR
jgi:addiction module HigA family antidote